MNEKSQEGRKKVGMEEKLRNWIRSLETYGKDVRSKQIGAVSLGRIVLPALAPFSRM